MGIQAFTPMGNTVTFTAATSAPAPVQAASRTLGGNQYRVLNTGSVVAFLSHGTTSSDVSNNALIVTSSQFSIVAQVEFCDHPLQQVGRTDEFHLALDSLLIENRPVVTLLAAGAGKHGFARLDENACFRAVFGRNKRKNQERRQRQQNGAQQNAHPVAP